MAWLVADGWDYYNGSGDLSHSVWDGGYSGGTIFWQSGTSTRFTLGQAVQFYNAWVAKNLSSNESTIYVATAYNHGGSLGGGYNAEFYVQFQDAGTAQCALCFETNGHITLRRPNSTGTVIADWTGAFPQDVWNHFQCCVVIDGAAGSLTIRKNGAASPNYTATGLNTRSTANNYCNQLVVGGVAQTGSGIVDDLLIFSASGGAPNSWVGDVRAICLPPINDVQKNFVPTPATPTYTFGHGNGSGSVTQSANTVYFSGPYAPSRGGPIVKINVSPGGPTYTGKMKLAVYANDGPTGGPGTLLGTSAEVINIPAGGADFTFSPTLPVSSTKFYYFAFLLDTTWTANIGYTSGAPTLWSLAQAYTSGFPASATAAAAFNPTMWLPGIATIGPANCLNLSEATANGDTDYVASANPGDIDLYAIGPLPFTPFAIVGVVSKVYLKKSDAGARQGQMLVKSGATQLASADLPLVSTYTYLTHVDAVDPNTGVAWTLAGVNAMQVGQKVTS